MFTTAGEVSRVAVGSEEQREKGTFAVAAIEFAAPPNKSLLDSMEGMDVPGGHPAGLKFIDWDVKKHFKLFGKKQRSAVAEAGRAAAKVEVAAGSSEPEAQQRGDATGWAAVDPEPEPDVPVSVRLAREEEERKKEEEERKKEEEERAAQLAAAQAEGLDIRKAGHLISTCLVHHQPARPLCPMQQDNIFICTGGLYRAKVPAVIIWAENMQNRSRGPS